MSVLVKDEFTMSLHKIVRGVLELTSLKNNPKLILILFILDNLSDSRRGSRIRHHDLITRIRWICLIICCILGILSILTGPFRNK